jgi:hypothetical protein
MTELYPDSSLYPSDDLYPGDTGAPPTPPAMVGPRPTNPDIPHIRFPFQRTNTTQPGHDPSQGGIAVVEQDSPEHIMSCEMVITVCPLGARDDRPEFGWAMPDLNTPPLDTEALKSALQTLEPRADVEITQYADLIDAAKQFIEVEVEIESHGDS